MKGLPGKLVMAAIVLSCGVIVQAEPSARRGGVGHGIPTVSRSGERPRAAVGGTNGTFASKTVSGRQ